MACEHKQQRRGWPGIAAPAQQTPLVAAAVLGHGHSFGVCAALRFLCPTQFTVLLAAGN